jgi:polyhydroxyalkanoate synthesis regulator phasin
VRVPRLDPAPKAPLLGESREHTAAVDTTSVHHRQYMSENSFSLRRAALDEVASDLESIADDLLKFGKILAEHARIVSREVGEMRKAEERFAARAKTQKATVRIAEKVERQYSTARCVQFCS